MNSNQRKSFLLDKYINNQCTPEEFSEFIDQVKSSTDNGDFDEAMQKHWQQSQQKALSHQPDFDNMRSNITLRLWALKKTKLHVRYAALVVLMISVTAAFFYYRAAVINPTVNYIAQYSAPAQTKVVILSDGTKVTLNANSQLQYPESFDGKTREVHLQGEAYFQVVHNVDKPFIIHSGKLRTHVLGTTFTVSAYSEKQAMNVTVLTGKVAVKNECTEDLAVLTRGESATLTPGEGRFKLGKLANPEDAIAWIDNKLIFDNMHLEDVALQLSNKYNVQINIADTALAHGRITGIFQSQSLPDILKALTRLTHSKYDVKQNIYTIHK